jgi:ABC transporter with metal-binding/Fe-S-binding domain ATP-binding protein
MRLASLYSGGKDSTFACMLMQGQGHEVPTLVTIRPENPASPIFHAINLDMVPLLAQAMDKELRVVPSRGEEAEDLEALRTALEGLEVDGIITGAIASDYQWDRINGVCEGLGLRVFSPLWRKDQGMLLRDMVEGGLTAVLVGTFAEGLDQSWLGRPLDSAAVDMMLRTAQKWRLNPSGEGGEYETLTLDSPLHKRPLRILESRIITTRDTSRLEVLRADLGPSRP